MSELNASAARTVMVRRSHLDGLELPQHTDFTVHSAPEVARFILRGAPHLVPHFGVETPAPLRATSAKKRNALWLGPDEFLLLAEGEEAASIQPGLEAAMGEAHSLVDVSHRQLGLVLEGALAARCISAGCPLDLRLAAFPVGMVARTIFMKCEMVLWRQGELRFHIEIWNSFAAYLVGHLAEAYRGTNGLARVQSN